SLMAALPLRAAAQTDIPLDARYTVVMNQQQGTIMGTVTGPEGTPLAGASVRIMGTSTSTATDGKGAFSFRLAPGEYTVEVSYMSYQVQRVEQVTVGEAAATTLEFVLEAAYDQLDEVVVVGYGTQKKVNMTGSVAVVSGEDL